MPVDLYIQYLMCERVKCVCLLCVWLCMCVGMSVYDITERGNDLPPQRRLLRRWNATLQNNEGIIHVPFSLCLTCKLLRSEFPQISNKFRTADHTLYKSVWWHFQQYGGKLGKPAACHATKKKKSDVSCGQIVTQHFIHFCTLTVKKKVFPSSKCRLLHTSLSQVTFTLIIETIILIIILLACFTATRSLTFPVNLERSDISLTPCCVNVTECVSDYPWRELMDF